MKPGYLFAIILTILPFAVRSQNTDTQFWFDYNPTYGLNTKWDVYGDAGIRLIAGQPQYRRIVIRPGFHYYKSDILRFSAGLGWFQDRYEPGRSLLEIRPYQGVRVLWPRFRNIRFSHYLRFEERWLLPSDADEAEFSIRGRYMLSTRINLLKNRWERHFYIPVAIEVFSNLGSLSSEFLGDQLRINPGLGYVIAPAWTAQLDVMLFSFRNPVGAFEQTDVVLRLRIYHLL